ncbi:hypothetical protein ABPG72_009402 [Tetrahymena utriculariae]
MDNSQINFFPNISNTDSEAETNNSPIMVRRTSQIKLILQDSTNLNIGNQLDQQAPQEKLTLYEAFSKIRRESVVTKAFQSTPSHSQNNQESNQQLNNCKITFNNPADIPTIPLADLLMQKKLGANLQYKSTNFEYAFDKIKIEECNYIKDTVFFQEQMTAAKNVLESLKLRDQYQFIRTHSINHLQDYVDIDEDGNPYIDWKKHEVQLLPPVSDTTLICQEGIIKYVKDGKVPVDYQKIPTIVDYVDDIFFILEMINNKVNKTICQERISLLKQKFQMHQTLNNAKELIDQKNIWGRDFYNTVKVDNHIHHSAAMNAQQLLKFILNKIDTEGDVSVTLDPVTKEPLTLNQLFQKFELTKQKITLDSLSVKADRTIYMRFDNFNSKYNPLGQPIFREVFMKTENYLEGRYLAELTREMFQKLEHDKYVFTEWRLSIYGKNRQEWKKLAHWVQFNKLQSRQNRWMIQIPRLYSVYKNAGLVDNFQNMLDNIFMPLFEVTLNPESDPELYRFLITLAGFDTVDDESSLEHFFVDDLKTTPSQFTQSTNPHYAYWVYYIYANISSLNLLRKERGLNTFKFRPHCGEAGDIDHLICAFLLSDSINHGILLEQNPVLLYMYYLKQIGLAMSPLSNNKLFLKYAKSPFYDFFKIGINVSLSTDDPLILHTTNDPLLEEYAISAQIWDLSSVDIAELARNSVKQSGFEKFLKYHWAGEYDRYQAESNRILFSNLPQSRYIYRLETLRNEYVFLNSLKYENNL